MKVGFLKHFTPIQLNMQLQKINLVFQGELWIKKHTDVLKRKKKKITSWLCTYIGGQYMIGCILLCISTL